MAYMELLSDLLLLAAEGGDYNKREAIARIQHMKPSERRLLREALSTLDDWLDEATLDLHITGRERRSTQ